MTAMDANLLGFVNRWFGFGDEAAPTALLGAPDRVVARILERLGRVLFIIDICANDTFG